MWLFVPFPLLKPPKSWYNWTFKRLPHSVIRSTKRTPKNYDGTKGTNHPFRALLSSVLSQIGDRHQARPDLLLAAWPEVIGAKLAGMTQAISFNDEVLVVAVRNSTLHSLLNQHEKQRLLKALREKFPKVPIKNILFRIG